MLGLLCLGDLAGHAVCTYRACRNFSLHWAVLGLAPVCLPIRRTSQAQ
jgi:hypothetical protein